MKQNSTFSYLKRNNDNREGVVLRELRASLRLGASLLEAFSACFSLSNDAFV